MSDTYIRFDDVDGESDENAAPAVRIPITIKHSLAPPDEEVDDLTGASEPASADGAEDAYFVVNDATTMTESEAATIDPYRNFKFTVNFGGDAAEDGDDDGDHDVIFDPDGDLMPPPQPTGAAEFDEQVTFNYTEIEYIDDTDATGNLTGAEADAAAGSAGTMVWSIDTDDFMDRSDDAEASATTHEIGHSLGLRHTDYSNVGLADAPDDLAGEDSAEDTSTADGPHQGRRDIGGYVPTSITAADSDQQASDTNRDLLIVNNGDGSDFLDGASVGDLGTEEEPQEVADLPDIIVLHIPDDEDEGAKGGHELTHIGQSGGTESASSSSGHFTQIVWADTTDGEVGGSDSFDFTDLPDDAEAPVPPGDIIIMPDADCPPDMTDDGGCADAAMDDTGVDVPTTETYDNASDWALG